MRSQNNEEQIILEYFGTYKGTLLDIGANDGQTLSNSFELLNSGWQGCLVEPSPTAFARLKELYEGKQHVHLFQYAIGNSNEEATLYESGNHLGKDDVALLSTLYPQEKERWKETDNRFHETKVQAHTFASFLEESPIKHFNLVSIDAEGADYDILCQMDLKALGCKMLIIEWNGKDKGKYLAKTVGYKLLAENCENLILAL